MKNFEKQWEVFIHENNIEDISKKDIARMFNEFGYSKGALDSPFIKSTSEVEE